MAVQVQEKMTAKGLGSKAGTSAKVRSDRRSDRGFEINRREQIAGFWRKDAGGPRVWKKQARSSRGFLEKRREKTAGLEETGALRSRVSGEKTRADRGFGRNRRAQVAG